MTSGSGAAVLCLDDPASFRAFYQSALPYVFGYFFNRCGRDRTTAEDLTQETFLAAVRGVDKHLPVTSPLAWVMGVARHKLIDHWRAEERAKRGLEAVESEAAVSPDAQVLAWDQETGAERAAAALAAVPAAQRSALVLHHVDGLSVRETAEKLGRSEAAVESLLARGRTSFRDAYREGVR